MTGRYDHRYYARQVSGALKSARHVVPIVARALAPASVVDFGCGQGAWLRAWIEYGVTDCCGIDGAYVNAGALQFPVSKFQSADLAKPYAPGRRFALAQSLEVAEHLPASSADDFVASLVAAAPVVLFSAAVRGQGGEYHVNEQPLEYWRERFAAHGYLPFDFLRPQLRDIGDVEPWYRFNAMVYAHNAHVSALTADVRRSAVPHNMVIDDGGSLAWNARRAVVSLLPRAVVNGIARGLATARSVVDNPSRTESQA